MITKQQALSLSLASVISSFLITGLTIFLLKTDSSFNLISNPCTALKVISAASIFLFAIKYVISNVLENSLFKEKPRAQLLTVVKSAGLLILMSFVFHCVAVLFGAPLYTSVSETFHFALLMTILICLPCCTIAGPKIDKWVNIFASEKEPGLETIVYLTAICAAVGAWLGAIPIPLDWDRPWQAWPITCSIGCISGYSIGLFLASLHLPHQYKSLFKSKSG